MSGASPAASWTDDNQQLLAAEFAWLKALLTRRESHEPGAVERPARTPPALERLAQLFGLSDFERDLLLLCASVEMDAELGACCAQHTGKAGATFGLALSALPDAHWSALTPVRPLRRLRLLELDEAGGLTAGRLRIDERILHYLVGLNYLDVRLHSLLHAAPQPASMAPSHQQAAEAIAVGLRASSESERELPVVLLLGDDVLGQADVAAEVATSHGLILYVLRAQDVPAGHAELEAFVTLWEREASLLRVALLISCGDDAAPPAACRLADALKSLVFVSAVQAARLERATLRVAVQRPEPSEQRRLWQETLAATGARLDAAASAALDGIASQFRWSARTIQSQRAQLETALARGADPRSALWSTCRSAGRSRLDELAQRIDHGAHWDDLILPDPTKATLSRIAAQVRNRLKVHREWGFAGKGRRGLGVSALFCGESGTGKTMAAEALAGELELDLYRIDLASMVSKYIGETEKNLRRVFDAAEECGAILLFDEADALFGKRSEVKDSHDRYANIEVSYLLQRMETYAGLAILTTNLKTGIDVAFQRRLRFVVQFPFPDHAQREAIWRVSFPEPTPLQAIDFGKLARLSVAGGNIRNIALTAAFQAAEAGTPITMGHLLQAAHYEAGKRERALSDAETRGWV